MLDRRVVVRLALDLSKGAESGVGPPQADDVEAKRKRLTWTVVIVAVVLTAVFAGYIWFLRNRKPDADPSGPEAISGGRVATRLSGLLDESYEYGWSRVEQELSPVGYGRWDPFKSLLPEPVKIVPSDVPSLVLPEPVDAKPPEPEPPRVRLTGVLKSGDKAIALLAVDGRSTMARVGDTPFYGAEVRAIDDKSITIFFRGVEFTYQLGGERR
jgi:hypothetical protein